MSPIETCMGCGVGKDPTAAERYPYPGDGVIDGRPIPPFFDLEVEPDAGEWRQARVCHDCFHRLGPDMWITRRGWESIGPTVRFEDLPKP